MGRMRTSAMTRGAMTRLMAWTAFWTFLLDQATKYLVVHWMGLVTRGEIDVLPGFVAFRMAWNDGVNFGLGGGLDLRWALVAVAVGISAFVALWIRREGGGARTHVSAGLLIGGAMGNVVDRVLYGAVADFLNVTCCGLDNPYAFNVADVAVFAGALGLVAFAGDGRPKRKPAPPAGKGGPGRGGDAPPAPR